MYWKEIDRADRGLVKAYPFSTHRSVVYGGYYIEKHNYITKRNARIQVWDVYSGQDLRGEPIKSFSTLKAAKAYIYQAFIESQNQN